MVTVSFPGLGIEPFSFNKVAFTIPIGGGIQVRWYGIVIVLGIILAFIYASYRSKQEGIIFDDLLDIAIWAVLIAMIGARTYYVLTTLDQYDSFYDMIAIWNGGIAIYGAVIGGAIAVFAVCRIKKISWKKAFDAVAPGVMIGQILGRWGNFFNGEAFGSAPKETNPLYFIRMGLQHENWAKEIFVQPTFLYESVWNLVGFLIINATYKKKKFDGQIFLEYITWYGFGRMFIEGLREDSLYVGPFRISQVLGFCCFVAGAVMLIVFSAKAKKAELAEGDYDSVYGKLLGKRGEKKAEDNVCTAAETKDSATVDTDDAVTETEENAETAETEENKEAAEKIEEKKDESETD